MAMVVRQDWLDQVSEAIIEPDRRIIDPHHHFFVQSQDFPYYDLASLQTDTATHRVEQTVYLQCWEGYRTDGPEEMMVVGETEWVDSIAAQARADSNSVQIGGIVATAELRLGDNVRPVLEAHVAASPLFRGIRLAAAWDEDENIMSMPGVENAELYDDAGFRAGFAVLADMGLSFDAYHYHHQTQSLARLARDFPSVDIIIDHLSTPLGVCDYAAKKEEVFETWQRDMRDIARCANVTVKLGGLAMPWNGFGYEDQAQPPTSDQLVADQSRYYHFAIDTFGPDRCMFESNFPVDKCALSYPILWNAFKKMASGYSESEKDALFAGTAERVYRLALV